MMSFHLLGTQFFFLNPVTLDHMRGKYEIKWPSILCVPWLKIDASTPKSMQCSPFYFYLLSISAIAICHMCVIQINELNYQQNRINDATTTQLLQRFTTAAFCKKWLGPLKQHCSHSYIILSTILLVKSRSAETSIYFAQKHQLSYASVLVTYLPVDMLVTSIQSYTPDKHQLAQVSLCNISQMLSIYSTGLKPGWPMAIFLLEMQVEVD